MSAGKLTAAMAILLALLLAITAMAVGDFERLDQTIARHRISVIDVAEGIRNRAPALLVDLRLHRDQAGRLGNSLVLPTAISLPDAMAMDLAGDRAALEMIVVYGYEGHRDWLALRAHEKPIFFLEDGVDAWVRTLLNPTIDENADAEARALFEARAPLARYFGGTPQVTSSPAPTESTKDQLTRLRRRGCGF